MIELHRIWIAQCAAAREIRERFGADKAPGYLIGEKFLIAVDVLACPHYGGRLRLIATLHDPAVIWKILGRLGRAQSEESPGPAPPAC
jgi:hypothetical protein